MRRNALAASHEERWVTNLKKALVKHGITVDAIAGVIKRAMDAERRGVGEDGKAVSLGPHHNVQLKAAAMATEIHLPRRAGQRDPGRVMLNVQAGAKVQLVFFGKAIEPTPHEETVPDHSPELKAVLVRAGKILPDGGVPGTAKAEASKALPERKAQERGERWLK